jgi:hypothetical protein
MATWAHATISSTSCANDILEACGWARDSSGSDRIGRAIIPLLAHIALIAACTSLALVEASWYPKAGAGISCTDSWIVCRSRAGGSNRVLAVRSRRARVLGMIGMLWCGSWADVAVVTFVSHHQSRSGGYAGAVVVKRARGATYGTHIRKVA